jgi:tRNA-specific 2-thiouridylase
MKSKKKPKVLVAMSGGVDSSVAALLMKKKGYEVIGAFIKIGPIGGAGKNPLTGECNWREERRMAMKIASILDIPLITIDSEKKYKKEVINKMFEEYKKGITPNPDVDCNQKIKFPVLIKNAEKLKADYVVTGHYARIKKRRGKYELFRGKDEGKDQSYFLYRLSQKDLKNSLFPIGNYTKRKVREIARKNGFPNYDKKSTVGICFIGKVNLKEFLQKKIKPKKGNILNPEGKIIGQHDGVYYYTIGQRFGPRYGFDIKKTDEIINGKRQVKRWYVVRKNVEKNVIVVAPQGHRLNYRKRIIIENPHWINPFTKPNKKQKIKARIRQVGELIPGKIYFNQSKKRFEVILKKAITGISQGQAIVLYSNIGKRVLGGGIINFE